MNTKQDKLMIDNLVIQEMLGTETTYNNGLGLLQTALRVELNNGNNEFLKKIETQINELKTISDQLLVNVRNATSQKIDDVERNTLRAERIQLLKSFFNAYQEYTPLYNQYTQLRKDNPSQFNRINGDIKSNNPNKLGLQDLLVSPVQRGPRFALLLDATLKNNDFIEEESLIELKKTKELISQLLIDSNSSQGSHTIEKNPGYQFGDVTRSLFSFFKPADAVKKAPVEIQIQDEKPYQFGDITWKLMGWKKPIQPSVTKVDDEVNLEEIEDPEESILIINNNLKPKN